MAWWKYDQQTGGGELDYPALGFRAPVNSILSAAAAPDSHWSSVGAGPETVVRYAVGSDPSYVEPGNGHVLVWSDTANAYVPTAVAPGVRKTLPLKTLAKLAAGTAIKISVLGDSVPQGSTASVPGTNDFVSLLCSGIASRYSVTVTKDNQALGGRTAWWQIVEKLQTVIDSKADVYILGLTGKNDGPYEYATGITKYIGQKRTASLAMIESAIRILRTKRPDADIVIMSGNPYGSASTSANTAQKAYSQGLARLAAHYGLPYADGWNATVVSGQIYADAGDLTDGVHPNDSGHQKLANAALALFPAGYDPSVTLAAPVLALPERVYKSKHAIMPKELTTHGATAYTDHVLNPANTAQSWTGSGPWTTSTAGAYHLIKAKCTDFSWKFTYGADQGVVDLWVDGVAVATGLDLSSVTDVDQWLSVPDLSPGVHTFGVKVVSGTVTMERVGFNPAASEFIDIRDTRVTLSGMGANNDLGQYWGQHSTQIADLATMSVTYVGTGLTVECYRSASGGGGYYFSSILTDGQALTTLPLIQTSFGDSLLGYGSIDVVSGLDYGEHTTVFTAQASGLYIGGFSALDERPELHLDVCAGYAKVGETVRPPLPFASTPSVTVTSTTANTASVSTASSTSFLLTGTSGDDVRWSARAPKRVLF